MILSLAVVQTVFTTQVSISVLGKDILNFKYVWGQEKWEIFTVLITNLEAGTCNSSRERNTLRIAYTNVRSSGLTFGIIQWSEL